MGLVWHLVCLLGPLQKGTLPPEGAQPWLKEKTIPQVSIAEIV